MLISAYTFIYIECFSTRSPLKIPSDFVTFLSVDIGNHFSCGAGGGGTAGPNFKISSGTRRRVGGGGGG